MVNRRFRRCHCINNNSSCNNKSMIEHACDENKNCPLKNYNEDCSCGFDEEEEINVFPENPMLAQSYVPIQYMDETFKPCIGLDKGTIFPELVSPYSPCDSMKDIEFLRKTNSIGEGCNANGRE